MNLLTYEKVKSLEDAQKNTSLLTQVYSHPTFHFTSDAIGFGWILDAQ